MPGSAYLHLLINHFPVIGTAALVVFFLYAIASKNDRVVKFSLLLIFLLALVTILVFITGNNAEGSVKGLEGVIEENIDPHQEFAFKSFIMMEVLGAFAFAGLIYYRTPKTVAMWFKIAVLALMLIVNGMMVYTAHLGGKIFHNEIMKSSSK